MLELLATPYLLHVNSHSSEYVVLAGVFGADFRFDLSKMRWSEDTTVKFVELYEENSCLWDVSSINYRNKQMRDSAINKIIADINIEGFGPQDVKNKIKTLRTTYSQECAKVEKHKKSGAGTDDLYTPAIKWFHIMKRFMKSVEAKRSSKSNLENSQEDDSQMNEATNSLTELPDATPTDNTNSESTDVQGNTSGETNMIIPTPKNIRKNVTSGKVSTAKKIKLQDVRTAVEELKQLNSKLQEPEPEDNEHDIFGKYTALQLKQLEPEYSLLAQQDIQNILTKYRVQSIRRRQSINRLTLLPYEREDSLTSVPSTGPSMVDSYSSTQSQSGPPTEDPSEQGNDLLMAAFTNTFTSDDLRIRY